MPTPQETQAWLDELKQKGNLSDDEFKALSAVVEKAEVAEYIKGSVLRQSDYSRKMNESAQAYKTKMSQIEKYESDLTNWKQMTETQYQTVATAKAQAEAEAERLRRLALSFGLEDSDLGAPPPQQATSTVQTPQYDPEIFKKDFLGRDEFNQAAAAYPLIVGEVNDIIAEHQELFGKQPRGMRDLVEQAMREGRTIRQVYEEKFDVPTKRQEVETAQREAEINRRVDEKLKQERTAQGVAAPRPASERGAIFQGPLYEGADIPKSVFESEGISRADSVRAAVADWNSRATASQS